MSLGTVLLVKIFPALLPPENPDDRDFYSVLDLKSKNVSEQEIRKAYKKKSLSLHPDKIAQRRENAITAEEAAQEYQLVQEAHTCLADKASRQKYHAVKCSPTRYRFLTQGGGMGNHMGLLENLSNASFGDKTRLVLFVSTFPALLLLQPILVAVKVNHILNQNGALEDASWIALLIPWWIFHGLFVLFWMTVTCLAPPGSKIPIAATAVEHLFWFIAEILLALRWDHTITGSYAAVFVPAYFALMIKWLHFVVTLQSITLDMSKMVSKNYFVDVILHGREPEDLEEEELKELQNKYVVVSQIPLEVEASFGRDDEDGENRISDQEKEDIRVASSREFEHALEAYSNTRRNMIKSIILDITFIILLILKVDGHRDISWWIVFLPIWLSYGMRLFYNCFVCCCSVGPMSADEMFIISKAREAMDTTNNANNNTDDDGNEDAGDPGGQGDNEKAKNEPNLEDKDGPVQPVSAKSETPEEAKAGGEGPSAKDAASTVERKETNSLSPGGTSATTSSPEDKTPALKVDSNDGPLKNENGSNDVNAEEVESSKKEAAGESFSVHMDEEAYRAYRSAYAEAEADATENRVRAGQTTCIACIQLILVLLLVIKLEQAYDAEEQRDEEGDDADVDVGYNALWLLFPLFLIVGFMISCCACLIYGAPSPEDLMQQEEEGSEAGEGNENDEEAGEPQEEASTAAADSSTPVVLAPPPAEPAATTSGEEEEARKGANEEVAQQIETEDLAKADDSTKGNTQTKPPSKQEVDDDINDLD